MAFNHLLAAMHDAFGPLSVMPVTHSVPMAKNHRYRRPTEDTGLRPGPQYILDRLCRRAEPGFAHHSYGALAPA